jgi:hypothetical protein
MDYKSIKTFEDACEDQSIDPAVLPDVSMLAPGMGKFLTAAYKLSVIGVSLNKDKKGNATKADWNDTDQYKWYPWMDVEADDEHPSGSGLSFYDTDYADSVTYVASRLTSRKSEIAEYFFEQFKDLWEDYILDRD